MDWKAFWKAIAVTAAILLVVIGLIWVSIHAPWFWAVVCVVLIVFGLYQSFKKDESEETPETPVDYYDENEPNF